MRVSHVLSAFATGLNPFLYYIFDLSELLRPNYRESLPKLGIIITRQSADWFQMIHQDITLVRIVDLFAEMILYNAYQQQVTHWFALIIRDRNVLIQAHTPSE